MSRFKAAIYLRKEDYCYFVTEDYCFAGFCAGFCVGFAGLGSAGLVSAGLGFTALGSAGLESAGVGFADLWGFTYARLG